MYSLVLARAFVSSLPAPNRRVRVLQDVELPQIVRVKFEVDGKPIEKTPHAEYGVLDVIWVKHWKKAIVDVRIITLIA